MIDIKQWQRRLEQYEKHVDTALSRYPVALQAERRLGIAKTRLVEYGGALLVGLLLALYLPSLALGLLALAYPLMQTYHLLMLHDNGDRKANDYAVEKLRRQVLTYWLVYGKLLIAEELPLLAAASRTTLYVLTKTIFLLWLQWGHQRFLPHQHRDAPNLLGKRKDELGEGEEAKECCGEGGALLVHDHMVVPIGHVLFATSNAPLSPHDMEPKKKTTSRKADDGNDDDALMSDKQSQRSSSPSTGKKDN
jgi:hypothetical protein